MGFHWFTIIVSTFILVIDIILFIINKNKFSHPKEDDAEKEDYYTDFDPTTGKLTIHVDFGDSKFVIGLLLVILIVLFIPIVNILIYTYLMASLIYSAKNIEI